MNTARRVLFSTASVVVLWLKLLVTISDLLRAKFFVCLAIAEILCRLVLLVVRVLWICVKGLVGLIKLSVKILLESN
jgi:hypothetical protein